jgi:hypothetical protein
VSIVLRRYSEKFRIEVIRDEVVIMSRLYESKNELPLISEFGDKNARVNQRVSILVTRALLNG